MGQVRGGGVSRIRLTENRFQRPGERSALLSPDAWGSLVRSFFPPASASQSFLVNMGFEVSVKCLVPSGLRVSLYLFFEVRDTGS